MASKRKATTGDDNCEKHEDIQPNKAEKNDYLELDSFSNLQHCTFVWTIENYRFYSGRSEISSPLFTPDSASCTKWSLELKVSQIDGAGNERLTFLNLVRHEFNKSFKKKLIVNCFFKLQTDESETLFEAKVQHIFRSKSSKGVEINHSFARNVNPASFPETNTLIITCEMFYQACESTPEAQCPGSIDHRFLELCFDFYEFFTKKDSCDLYMRTDDGEISAHKAFLIARSRYFLEHFKNDKGNIIYFGGLSIELLKRIILYAYTGIFDLDGFMRSELFMMFSYVDKFDLHPLKELLTPVMIEAFTTIYVEHCEFTWSIKDFSFYENQCITLKSAEFNCGNPLMTETCYLNLILNSHKDPNYIGVWLTISGLRSKVLVSAEIFPLITGAATSEVVRLVQLIENDEVFTFNRFLPKSKVACLRAWMVPNDVLRIRCILKISDMSVLREFSKDVLVHSPMSNFDEKSLRKLSDDFYQLQEDPRFYDIELKSGDKKFQVHKSLLLSRWPEFYKKFDVQLKQKRSNTFYFIDVPSYAMKKVLIFLYSGRMDSMYPYGAIDIYLAAEKLNISNVKFFCSLYLKSQLDANNCSNILALANTVSDSELKLAVIKYIKIHPDEVKATIEWANFKKQWPDLAREVFAETE